MNVEERIDPEYAAALAARPVLDLRDIDGARRAFAGYVAVSGVHPDVRSSDHVTPSHDGAEIRLRAFAPATPSGPMGCVLWIPGGGYVLTRPDLDDAMCSELVARHGCTVVSVEWRRAPEHRFPAAVEDAYAGLRWVFENAARIGVDHRRVVIGGMSSGGGTAAALALLARDRAELSIGHQILVYPMLDDTNTTLSSSRVTDSRLWSRDANERAWRAYLGDAYGTEGVSPYAAPARAADLHGLAPATIFTAELDLFLDEDIVYAQRLLAAGVSVELHVYARVTHSFPSMNPNAATTRQFLTDLDRALERALSAGPGAPG